MQSLKTITLYLLSNLGKPVYRLHLPLLRVSERSSLLQRITVFYLTCIGRAIFWAARGKRQNYSRAVLMEWQRILGKIGYQPALSGEGRSLCFAECSLGLKTGDTGICNMAMSVNQAIIQKAGGSMVIEERLTDVGCQQCKVRVDC